MGDAEPEGQAAVTSDWNTRVIGAVEAHRNGLLAAAARLVGRDHAADVVQDMFIRVWSRPDLFDDRRGTLAGYLYMNVRCLAIDSLRRSASRQIREQRVAQASVPLSEDEIAAIIRAETGREVRVALDALRAEEREAIVAAYFGHLTYRVVAQSLGVPEGTVKSRIRVGLMRMRAELLGGTSDGGVVSNT